MTDLNLALDSDQSNLENENDFEAVHVALLPKSKIAWLQEISFSVTKLLIIIVTCLVALLSILARAEWYDILVRIVVTIISLGLLGWLVNWLLGRYLVETKLIELTEEKIREEEMQAAEEAQGQADKYEDDGSSTFGIEA